MDFHDSPEDGAFRQEVREFLAAELPKGFGRPSGPAPGGDADVVRPRPGGSGLSLTRR